MTDYTKDLVGLGMPGPLALYMSPLLGANVSSPPGGSSGQIQYNKAGVFGGAVGSSIDSSGNVTIGGNITTSGINTQVLGTGGGLLGGNTGHPALSFSANSSFGFDYDTVRTATAYVENTAIYIGFNPTGLSLRMDGGFSWSSGSDALGSQDTGLSRISAGVIGVGNGTQGDVSGTLQAAITQVGPRTFASLPASPAAGMISYITDSTVATVGVTIAGTGAHKVLGWFNNVNWTVIGV